MAESPSPKPELLPSSWEDTCVRRAREGDADAFRSLFDRFAPGVRRFLSDLLGTAPEADEATQETFVRAHARLTALERDARVAPWLFGIARNVAFERWRERKSEQRAWAEEEDWGATLAAVLPSPTPETVLLDRETEGALQAALTALSPQRRAALLLRLDHGLSYEEISQAMGWPLQKVKNEIHRARLKLRTVLSPHLVGGAR